MQPAEQIKQWIDDLHTSDDPRTRRTLLRRITESVRIEEGLLYHEVVVALLWALRDEDASVKRMAVAWLPRLDRYNPQVEDVAIAHIQNKDLRVREGATFFLWLISSKRCQGMMREIVETNDPRFPYKHWVFQLLADEEIPVETLLQYLRDESALDHVLVRLGEVRDDRVAPAMVASIENKSTSNAVRKRLFRALSRRDDVNMNLVPYLKRWLKRRYPAEINDALITLCRHHGDPSLVKPLLVGMQHEPALLLALPEMAFVEHERKLSFLLDRLREADLRTPAMRALGWLGDPVVLDRLLAYLDGNEEEVVIALANIGGARARDLLLLLLYHYWYHEATLKTIIGALDYVGDPAAAPHLVPLLYELRPVVTAEAVRALGGLGNPVVVPDLILKLGDHRDPDEGRTHGHTMSILAARALEAIGTPEALDAIARYRGESGA